MKVTTSRSFRKRFINTYSYADFDNFEDYFLYLHLNHKVLWMHFLGAFLGIPFLPWAVYWAYQGNFWPFMGYTALFYGSGFSSHWLNEGKISRTTPDYGPSYFYVININFRMLTGQYTNYEAAYCQKYPHTLWVYDRTLPPPPCILESPLSASDAENRSRPAFSETQTESRHSEQATHNPSRIARTIHYPRWLKGFFGFLLVGGFLGTLWGPTHWRGWGFLLQFLFLSLGFVCIYVAELENDRLADARLQVGNWRNTLVALSLYRTHQTDPEQRAITEQLQNLNRDFWREYLQQRRWILRQGFEIPAQQAALKALAEVGKAWQKHVADQLAAQTPRCEAPEADFLQNLNTRRFMR